MEITRIEDQVLIEIKGQTERISAEEALLVASNLESEADHILRATVKEDGN